MKNNKGFTIVELLVSFALSMILVIIMFQLIINLKELYQTSGIKTEMMNKQYLITNKMYTDLTEKKLTMISSCGVDCINFTFNDNTTTMFYVDTNNGTISYDDYTIKINNNSYIETPTISTVGFTSSSGNDRILSIKVPIYNSLFKNDNFGINIIYIYNSNELIDEYF